MYLTNFFKLDPDLHFLLKQLDPHSEKLMDPDPQKMIADLQPRSWLARFKKYMRISGPQLL